MLIYWDVDGGLDTGLLLRLRHPVPNIRLTLLSTGAFGKAHATLGLPDFTNLDKGAAFIIWGTLDNVFLLAQGRGDWCQLLQYFDLTDGISGDYTQLG